MDFKKITNFLSNKEEKNPDEVEIEKNPEENKLKETPPNIDLKQGKPEEKKEDSKSSNLIDINDKIEKSRGEIEIHKRQLADIEKNQKLISEKIDKMESQMVKFLSLYELISNQFNPFIDEESRGKFPKISKKDLENFDKKEEVEVKSREDDLVLEEENNEDIKEVETKQEEELKAQESKNTILKKIENSNEDDVLDESFIDLDTLNIKKDVSGIPLKKLKTDTNSLVILLNWLKYLVKICGHEKSREALKYYAEVLKWISSEVYFEIDKYLDGLEIEPNKKLQKLRIRDHIVSLYFISKLNNGILDKKLTDTVLKIIKSENEK